MRKRARTDRNQVTFCMACGITTLPGKKGLGVYCSRRCAGVAVGKRGDLRDRGRTITQACAQCGKSYTKCMSRLGKFCSQSCFGMNRRGRPNVIRNPHIGPRRFMRYRARFDSNQPEIIEAFQKLGASVLNCSAVGSGFPDLIIGFAGGNHLVEVKRADSSYGRRGLSPSQQKWAERWPTAVYVVRTIDDVIRLIEGWK